MNHVKRRVVALNPDVLPILVELANQHGVVPDDPDLLATLWPGECPADLPVWIETLINAGALRRVWLGSEPHLAIQESSKTGPHRSEVEPLDTTALPNAAADAEAFSIDLEVDVLSERLLFYRLVIVFEVLMGLFGLREVAIWATGP